MHVGPAGAPRVGIDFRIIRQKPKKTSPTNASQRWVRKPEANGEWGENGELIMENGE
jgi:hypothetical protein